MPIRNLLSGRPLFAAFTLHAMLSSHAAEPVEARLASGEVVYGELEPSDPDQIRIRIAMPPGSSGRAATGVMSYPKDAVAELIRLRPAYRERVSGTGEDAAAQLALARWCQGKGMTTEAALHAQQAHALGAGAPATDLLRNLGLVQHEERWLARDEDLALHDLAEFRGQVVSRSEVTALQQAQTEMLVARSAATAASSALSKARSDLASAGRRIESRERDIAAWEQRLQDNSAQQAVDAAQKRLASAEAAARQRGGGRGGRGGRGRGRSGGTSSDGCAAVARAVLSQAQAALAEDQRRKTAAKRSIAEAQKDIQDSMQQRSAWEAGMKEAEQKVQNTEAEAQAAAGRFQQSLAQAAQMAPHA